MDDRLMQEQAKTIAALLPMIMRQLFTGEDDPTADLPLAQLRVCGILQNGSRSMSSLSRELGVSLSALTQIADRLERADLVHRVPEANDRRIRCLQLTQAGEETMQRHKKHRAEHVLNAIEQIPPEERAEVQSALEKLLEASLAIKERKAAV
jgi:DNA-binding MarR family transcriptional regulator